VILNDGEADGEVTSEVRPTIEIPTAEVEEPTRPRSPWTPSWSVTTQGSPNTQVPVDLPAEETVLFDLADTPSEVAAEAASPPVQTPVLVIQAEAASDPLQVVDYDVTPIEDTSAPLSPPERPWTPSYSVTTQGSPLPSSDSLELSSNMEVEELDSFEPELAPPAADEGIPLAEERTTKESTPSVDPQPDNTSTEGFIQTTQLGGTEASFGFDPSTQIPGVQITGVLESHASLASYSVSRQGSPRPPHIEVAATDDLTLNTRTPVPNEVLHEDSTISPSASAPSPRPWTPSYSVSQQGSPLPKSAELVEPTKDASFQQNSPSVNSPVAELSSTGFSPSTAQPSVDISPAVEVQETSTAVLNSEQPNEVADIPALVSPVPRPWTPSYSVSRQGTPSPEAAIKRMQDQTEENPDQGTSADNAEAETQSVTDEQAPNMTAHSASLRPGLNWTPSYSVTTMGNSPEPEAIEFVAQGVEPKVGDNKVDSSPTPETFPSTEQHDHVEPLQSSVLSLPANSGEGSRGRRESTTSSRFFPGGWFSSPPVSQGKPSLDIARGEFSPTATKPPTSPTGAEEPAAIASESVEEEKKSKWCTIM
jgi:hypothetical protein